MTALLLGAAIGVERQYRQRSAGLRTNALVALGAGCFALIGFSMANEASPSRMAAQVVSGIGFLGAGAIMREGLNVKGLNTAATLWCAAAVGVACGAGLVGLAALMAGLIILVNIVVRPLVGLINQAPQAGAETERGFRITAICTAGSEAPIRLLIVKQIAASETRLLQLDTDELEDGMRVVLTARVEASGDALAALETIIARLSLEPAVTRAGWAEEGEE